MKIYIDVGNTSTSIYLSENDHTTKTNIKTYKNIKIVSLIESVIEDFSISTAFLTSVVPEINDYIIKLLSLRGVDTVLFTHEYFNEVCDYGPLPADKMGADRVIVDSASIVKYGSNCIVIDLGTAVSVDVIFDSKYISGYIYPGLATSMNALISNASMLTPVEFRNLQDDNVCLDTEKQINDGLIIGLLGSMAKLIEVSVSHFNDVDYKVVITGGFFNMIVELIGIEKTHELLNCEFIYDKDLIIDGMTILDGMIRS